MRHTLKHGALRTALALAGGIFAVSAHAQTVTVTGYTNSTGPIDLTLTGTSDWAKWGGNNNQNEFDQKSSTGLAGGPAVGLISNVTAYVQYFVNGNYNAPGVSNGGLPTVAWSDGASSSINQTGSTDTGLQNLAFHDGGGDGQGLGFQFTALVPSQQQGILTLYVGSFSGEDTLVATAPDASTSTGTFNPGLGNTTSGFFTISLSNPSATNQTFKFSEYESSNNGGTLNYNNPKITAAALTLSPTPEPSGVAALGLGLMGLGALALRARTGRPVRVAG